MDHNVEIKNRCKKIVLEENGDYFIIMLDKKA